MPDQGFLTENSDSLQVLTGVVSLVVTLPLSLLGWWLKRKQVTDRVHLDTPVGINPAEDTSMIDVRLVNQKNVVDKPSFALVRIANTGNAAIRTEDFEDALTPEFGGRTVVDAEIVEGDALLRRVERCPQWPNPGGAKLVLPKSPLNREDRIKLLVLLSGEPDADLVVTGSSAFAPVVEKLAEACRDKRGSGAKVELIANSAYAGVDSLVDSTDEQRQRIAVVVNAATGVRQLTTEQVREIYRSGTRAAFEETVLERGQPAHDSETDCEPKGDGQIFCEKGATNDLLVAVATKQWAVGYSELEAARKAAEVYPQLRIVTLGGVDPDDLDTAKDYPFRAKEYFYTKGKPADGAITQAFIECATSPAGVRVVAELGFGNRPRPCRRHPLGSLVTATAPHLPSPW
ncbi:hypothetical protein KCV87_00045 [Actinosynnema pretiosum subsp. pretiosum]|uniref:Uncharacterized protein n=1 Tax=Actinosynnema pretiosum subsp. pretiosum TaxID=103721 RepID=A0AA45L774_9PSEU|nr:hypothetical protein KCV87_00045 [Actinosynnema pretiosum subsp. pretiosum]